VLDAEEFFYGNIGNPKTHSTYLQAESPATSEPFGNLTDREP